MLSALFCFAALLAGASPQLPEGGDEGAPTGLTVVIVDVGQGDGALILSPDGTLHVFDAGEEGMGTAAMIPAVTALKPRAYGFAFVSHFHIDHLGGMDDVLARFAFQQVYDRGDVARPSNSSVNDYLAAAGSKRRTIQVGQVLQLGGGARVTVLAANGQVLGGTTVPVSGQAQEENARSIALRLDHGDFSMWLGGDLTGGGSGTPDVESPAALACGDVDVYHVNHHGSNTSTATNLVSRLAPELAVVSCGSNNSFGHPTTTTINRINQAAATRILLSTTNGTGAVGFGAAGSITIRTDGTRYRASARNGEFLDFFVDEVTTRGALPSDIVVSEIHRNPSRVADAYGEYIEIVNIGPAPVSLKSTRVRTNGGVFTIFTNLAAYPGRPLILAPDGDSGRNGGLPLGVVWPFQALSLGDTGDTVVLDRFGQTLDSVTYSSGFAGGSGVAAERVDLRAPAAAANFVAASVPYGQGDRGTPARRNTADATQHPATLVVEVSPQEIVFRASELSLGGKVSAVALSFGNTGFPLFGTLVPLAFDPLFELSLLTFDFVVFLPPEGYRSVPLPLPSPNPLTGLRVWACHILVDVFQARIPDLSPAVSFVFP
jgi:beta-lactamase superfamily II metal-dependent hydrolase